ncbi:MAG: DUF2269 domain-containing protein [Pseudomonadota bacterium]
MYDIAKFLHLTGFAMLMGNITVTAIWKVFADRNGDAAVLSFAQKLVTYTDWSMTFWGVVLIMGGGYTMSAMSGYRLTEGWLLWSQILFVISGGIWLSVLVPIQIKQAQLARTFDTHRVPEQYRQMSRKWIMFGLISTVPLLVATWLMITKPF